LLFTDLKLIEPIIKALQQEGYTQPTPIQQQAIPLILQGKDLLGCAQTGTGKTAAFAIPMLQLMAGRPSNNPKARPIRTLILTPTRELAIQIEESFKAYGSFLPLKTCVIFGGVGQNPQVDAINRGPEILVATPGRLLDLIAQGFIDLKFIEIFVLDEADRMLDMGFVNDVKRIITKLPTRRQTLFFSATMPLEIQSLANAILNQPQKVEVTPVSSTAETIQQHVFFVDKNNKKNLLMHILKNDAINPVLVFTRTKHGADKVVKELFKEGITAEAIHGNKSQNARQRALTNFKERTTRVLVATDIAARGIDVDELAYVINYELPNVPETYVHRIGRTGRAGLSGTAFSFCEQEEVPYLKDIQKLIGKQLPVDQHHPYHMDMSMSASSPNKQTTGGKKPMGHKPNRPNAHSQGNRNRRFSNQGR
jgi:ATP-dependent RNA helicase RhlE